MLEGFFDPAVWPFSVALCLMLLIALTEAVGMLIGVSAFGFVDQLLPEIDMDADVDADADVAGGEGWLSGVLGWLCIGKVPVLVLLVAFLTAFGLVGLSLQGAVHGLVGGHLPVAIAAVLALLLALPPMRWAALGLARIMPQEETEAVSTRSFIGKVAVITGGAASRGVPAQAKLRDEHGQMHYVLVEPDADDGTLENGAEILLISQVDGGRFRAIGNDNALLSTI